VFAHDRRLIADPRAARASARAALAAKALMHAGDMQTAGRRREALQAVMLAFRLGPHAVKRQTVTLMAALAIGDDYRCHRTTKRLLAVLSGHVGSPRYAERLARAAAVDPGYEAMLARSAAALRRLTPRDAVLATATKWDPTLLRLSGRHGIQFPDRRRMPDGYPADATAVIEHLAQLRAAGVTHLTFTSATRWWLDHYPAFADHLSAHHRLLNDDLDCVVYEL
jgi:hypothetical protein